MGRGSGPGRWASDLYEYAFTPVPAAGRKPTSSVLIVTMGYTVALSCFVIGTRVGYALPLGQALLACTVGNLFLMGVGVGMGIMGYETGWSTAFLVRQMFGGRASRLFSAMIIALSIYWVAVNGDSFARMLVTTFPQWPVPIALTAVGLVALWGLTGAWGWRGLALTSWILTPATVLLAVSGLGVMALDRDLGSALAAFVPTGEMTLTTAMAAVAGNYIFGCIISPDLCRFAKSRRAVLQVIVPSHCVGFFLLNVCGVLVAQVGDTSDFAAGAAKLGLALPYLLCAAMGLWTTENYNMYSGSLAAQNLFLGTPVEGNLSHGVATWILAGLSAAFAALHALNYLMPFITIIAVLVPSAAGLLFAEFFIFRHGTLPETGRWIWLPAWAAGGVAGLWAYYINFLIPPILALLVSGAVYWVLRRLCRPRIP